MNDGPTRFPWPDPEFEQNRQQIPIELLMPYNGQHVAYSWDGKRVLAGDPDETHLFEKLRAGGIDTNGVVFSFFDVSDISYIGGSFS